MKNFLFTFDDSFGNDEEIETLLRGIEEIKAFRSDLPRAYQLKSNSDATCISNEIFRRCSRGARYYVLEITDNSDGMMSPQFFDFLAP